MLMVKDPNRQVFKLEFLKALSQIHMVLPKAKNYVLFAEFPVGSKFHFSQCQWKTYFSQFIDKFFKFQEMDYLIHYVKFEILKYDHPYVPILFSIVKLKLGLNFCKFIYRFKTGIFECLFQPVFPRFFQSTAGLKIGIFQCCSGWTSQVFPIHEKRQKIGIFGYQVWLYYQDFTNSLKSLESGILKSLLFSYFVRF